MPDLNVGEPPVGINTDEWQAARRDPVPFYVVPNQLSAALKSQTPTEDIFRGALHHLGYRTAKSHCKPGSVKTDAPWPVLWRLMREWCRQKAPPRMDRITPTMAAWRLWGLDKQTPSNGTDDKTGSETNPEPATKPTTADASDGKEELWATLVFDDRLKRLVKKDEKRLVRYQVNPRENWGPMARAKGR